MKNKWKVLFFALLTLVFTLGVITFNDLNTQGGNYPYLSTTNIDSAVTQTSDYFSIAGIDGQTVYGHFYYSSTANDSLQVIILGRDNAYLTGFAVDTVFIKALTNYEITMTPTYHMSQWAIQVVPYELITGSNNIGDVVDNGILYSSFYATGFDVMPPYQDFQKAPKMP